MEFKNLNQHKAFINSEAKRLGISPTAAYTTYYARMLLERMSEVNYGTLLVKGSFSQYVHLNSLSRPVLDIDLSSTYLNNIPLDVFYTAIYNSLDDVVTFDMSHIPRKTINGIYKMVINAKVKYPNDKEMIIAIPIDFKPNNIAIFEPQFKKVEPLFQGDKEFYINTPSFEEHIAEKLYIIAHNRREDILNTRVKDFYDIYKLHGTNYDADKFNLYFQMMCLIYGENLGNLDAEFLDKKFIKRHEEIWEKMQIKYDFVDKELDFDEAVYYTKAVLKEQILEIRNGHNTKKAKNLVRKRLK